MAIKIYIDSNYLSVEFDTGRIYSISANEANIEEVNSDPGHEAFIIKGLPELNRHVFKLADLIDVNDVPFTLSGFRSFYKSTTGIGNAISPPMTQAVYDALTEAQKNNGTIYVIH